MPIDYKNYPSNWKTEIRPAILQRAHGRCESCGINNGAVIRRDGDKVRRPCQTEWDMINADVWHNEHSMTTALKKHGFIRVVLTIAHLNHDTGDNRPENLKALCQKCHLELDKEQHRQSRYQNKTKNIPDLFKE